MQRRLQATNRLPTLPSFLQLPRSTTNASDFALSFSHLSPPLFSVEGAWLDDSKFRNRVALLYRFSLAHEKIRRTHDFQVSNFAV